jgi:hypothetical protein
MNAVGRAFAFAGISLSLTGQSVKTSTCEINAFVNDRCDLLRELLTAASGIQGCDDLQEWSGKCRTEGGGS